MWKKLGDTEYFLLFTQANRYEICVTDYITLWTAFFSEKAFVAQLKDSNDGLELGSDNNFIRKGLYMLSNLDKLKKLSIRKEENGKSLFIFMRMSSGFPFCFECKLSKGSEEFYYERVTRTLLKTVSNLRASQSELRRLLIKKDKEIDEYKCEGGEIVLRHLKTVAFNDYEHMNKFTAYEINFGSAELPSSLLEKDIKVPETQAIPESVRVETSIKQEPNIIKQEPGNITQEPNSIQQELGNIKQELGNKKQEPNSTHQELDSIKQELNIIKQELHTPVFEEATPILIAPSSVSCKQEVIRTEIKSSQRDSSNPRKRLKKLNY